MVIVMVAMLIVGGAVVVAFVVALVGAELVDRRRSIELGSDPSRLAPQAVHPPLPWV
jgi:hypothetical protein